jgi:hypothetical protein
MKMETPPIPSPVVNKREIKVKAKGVQSLQLQSWYKATSIAHLRLKVLLLRRNMFFNDAWIKETRPEKTMDGVGEANKGK